MSLRLLGAALAALLPVPAAPALPPDVTTGTVDSGMPPARFQGNTEAILLFTDRRGIDRYCGVAEAPNVIIACHRRIDGVSYIVMPNPCPGGNIDMYARIMCHEIGHANGWSGEHEL